MSVRGWNQNIGSKMFDQDEDQEDDGESVSTNRKDIHQGLKKVRFQELMVKTKRISKHIFSAHCHEMGQTQIKKIIEI